MTDLEMKVLAVKASSDDRAALAGFTRIAKAAGFVAGRGGWIYWRDGSRTRAQGWSELATVATFSSSIRARMTL